MHPVKTHNEHGERVFNLSDAKPLLQEDMANKRHTQMTRQQLQNSRDEYKAFKSKKFKERIYQEFKRQKFVYHMELQQSLREKNCHSQIDI